MKRKLMTVSAPGKIIISGEHSVVYQKNAICGAINLKCRCQCWEEELSNFTQQQTNTSNITFILKNLNEIISIPLKQISIIDSIDYAQYSKNKQFLDSQHKKKQLFKYKILKCIRMLIDHQKERQEQIKSFMNTNKRYYLQIDSQIPIGGGLGSSAAFSTCIAASLLGIICYNNKVMKEYIPNKPLINKLSLQYQKIYHSKPSGLDNYISLNGGLLIYNRVSQPSPIDWKLKLKFGVIDSKIQKNTAQAVLKVATKYPQQGSIYLIIQSQQQTKQIIQKGDQNSFLQGLNTNHNLLKSLDLSNNQIQNIVCRYNKTKGIAAKITGAGMGGYVLIVSKEDNNQQGIEWKTISKQGLTVEFQ